MEKSALPQGEISGTVLLYSRPEPLNPDLHGKLGVKRQDNPFGFAATTHLIPLTVTEFQPASISYPIIFVGDEYTPVAVMGLKEGENLFISPNGAQDPDAYIPAYIRRYPFVFANDQTSDRMILCIDRGASIFDEKGGDQPLFVGSEPSDYTKAAMDFCREFENERHRTDDFVKVLRDADLFEVKQAMFTPRAPDGTAGEPQMLAEYFAVSEEKLAKLPKEKVLELFENGALMQIYSSMVSLLNWERLLTRAMTRQTAAANLN
ncbi:MAG: peptidase [Caulobacterales bacterium 32-69-10]|nr:MAG: peptidase [Caulobacterales bacterium 32-69-10]